MERGWIRLSADDDDSQEAAGGLTGGASVTVTRRRLASTGVSAHCTPASSGVKAAPAVERAMGVHVPRVDDASTVMVRSDRAGRRSKVRLRSWPEIPVVMAFCWRASGKVPMAYSTRLARPSPSGSAVGDFSASVRPGARLSQLVKLVGTTRLPVPRKLEGWVVAL